MSGDSEKPEGPDFTQGVAADKIAEGAMLAGRVGEEAVLIVRVEGKLSAVSALCTHYQGPLAKGIIVDGAVRCPWHHAHFCLKTGEATGAPAIDPLTVWAVEEKDGQVFVSKKADQPDPAKGKSGKGPRKVVILGGGAAGFATAEMLRRRGFDGAITMLSADRDAPYDRPNCSKDYLAGDADPAWMPLRDKSWWKDNDIDLRLKTEAASLDLKAKAVALERGDQVTYDVLVLATGAEPQRPPVKGFDGPNVFTLRSLADADAIIKAAEGAKTVAILGASFIGLEAAGSLIQRGLEVHVAAQEDVPLAKVLGEDIGRWIKALHEEKGVCFHLGRKARGFEDGKLALDDGPAIAADLLILGMGVKPRTALAEAAGLKVDDGVIVDASLMAVEGVYAVGDIARYPDPVSGKLQRVEHWVHAERQGQHVARALTGERGPFADAPFFWSAHYGTSIRYVGHAEDYEPPKLEGSLKDKDAKVEFRKDSKLLAVATLGRDKAALRAGAAFENA